MSMSEEAVTSIYIERLDYLMKISKIMFSGGVTIPRKKPVITRH